MRVLQARQDLAHHELVLAQLVIGMQRHPPAARRVKWLYGGVGKLDVRTRTGCERAGGRGKRSSSLVEGPQLLFLVRGNVENSDEKVQIVRGGQLLAAFHAACEFLLRQPGGSAMLP